ncbi:NepR family anti-sigma factor [Microvirga tunisiensis]|uniref:NepR family anti-sigma factor n=1 Tax=Microvirga tunisiensis TaxID=2108360 RepID=UPI003B84607B
MSSSLRTWCNLAAAAKPSSTILEQRVTVRRCRSSLLSPLPRSIAATLNIGEWRASPGPLRRIDRPWSWRNSHVLTPWPEASQTALGDLNQLEGARGEPHPEPTLPPHVAACLGERLRVHYAHLVSEPVPDDLLRILQPLGQTGRAVNDH